jgi:ubiquinone/menaquinone biosynthesis C-methylase UbiE
MASGYDEHQWNDKYERLVSRIVADVGNAEKVPDVATGTGVVAFELSRTVASIEATDLSAEMIHVAQEKAARKDMKGVRFSVQDACRLDFPNETFDAVVICNSLHVMPNPGKALKEACRVLKGDGRLVAPTACLGETEESREKSKEMADRGFAAYHLFSAQSLCETVESCGFRVLDRGPMAYRMPMEYVLARKTEGT